MTFASRNEAARIRLRHATSRQADIALPGVHLGEPLTRPGVPVSSQAGTRNRYLRAGSGPCGDGPLYVHRTFFL